MSATASPLLSLLHRPADALLAENWTAAQFAAATAALAVRLRENDVHTVALWFDDGARFASALLSAWQAASRVAPRRAKAWCVVFMVFSPGCFAGGV